MDVATVVVEHRLLVRRRQILAGGRVKVERVGNVGGIDLGVAVDVDLEDYH